MIRSTSEECKNLDADRGWNSNWMNQYQTANTWVCFRGLLSKILVSSNNLHKIQTGGWLNEVLDVVKTWTIKKWKLNTCDKFFNLGTEDFFVGRRLSKVYTMWKFYKKHIQYNQVYNMQLYAGSLEGNAYSHISTLLRDDVRNALKTSLQSYLLS